MVGPTNNMPRVGPSIPARPRPAKDGQPYPIQLGQHVVLSLPQDNALLTANRLPLTATTYLLNSGNNSGVAPAFVQTKAATSTAR